MKSSGGRRGKGVRKKREEGGGAMAGRRGRRKGEKEEDEGGALRSFEWGLD